MSVVAGCLLTDGVLIASHTRITYASGVQVDNAIKILPFALGTAIGYVADDVDLASALLQHLIRGRDQEKHTDPATLTHWLPRLLRAEYRRLKSELQKPEAFIVASSFADRPLIVESVKVGGILFDAVRSGEHAMALSFMAIGAGSGVVEGIQRVHARMLFDNPGNIGLPAFWFREAIRGFVEHNKGPLSGHQSPG